MSWRQWLWTPTSRWARIAVLGSACAVAGTIIVPSHIPPSHRAEMLLRLAAPQAGSSDSTSWLDAHVRLLRSPQTLAAAAQTPQWKGAGLAPGFLSDDSSDRLQITPDDKGSIRIQVTDAEAGKASAAVEAVVASYRRLLSEQADAAIRPQMQALSTERAALMASLQKLNDSLAAAQTEGSSGNQSLQRLYQSRLAEQQQLHIAIEETRKELASFGADSGSPTNPLARPLSAQEIAAADPLMHQYLRQQAAIQRDIEKTSRRLPASSNDSNPQLLEAHELLAQVRISIDRYAQTVRERESLHDGLAPAQLTILQAAQLDPETRRYLAAKASLIDEQDRLALRLGDDHEMTRDTARLIAAADLQIGERVQGFRDSQPSPLNPPQELLRLASGARRESLRQRQSELQRLYDQKSREASVLSERISHVAAIKKQAAPLDQRLSGLDQRMAQLTTLAAAQAQVTVADGDRGPAVQPAGIDLMTARAVGGIAGLATGLLAAAVLQWLLGHLLRQPSKISATLSSLEASLTSEQPSDAPPAPPAPATVAPEAHPTLPSPRRAASRRKPTADPIAELLVGSSR